MRERGILFSAPMVRALLAGTKTQTRRLLKPRHDYFIEDGKPYFEPYVYAEPECPEVPCPYGEPGDRLWVRETWYCDDYTAGDFEAARVGYVSAPPSDAEFVEQWRNAMDYRATHDCNTYEAGCPCSDDDGRSSWRPSIFMPRWASRITLEVVGVRVERVQDISESDAQAEGVRPFFEVYDKIGRDQRICTGELARDYPYRASFACLWDEINGDRSLWSANPWVWVVEFKQIGVPS